jgi:hypothetical protein
MGKKEFKSGLDILLQGTNSENHETKPEVKQEISFDKEIRATFILTEDHVFKLKAIAYWQRKQIKQVLQESLNLYFKQIPKNEMNIAIESYSKIKN